MPGKQSFCHEIPRESGMHQQGRRRRWIAHPNSLLAVILLVSVAFANSLAVAKEKKISRQVSGRVLDESDNPISGASVTLTDLTTGEQLGTYTKESGLYLFTDLKASHDYEVQATYQGKTSASRKVSTFDNRNRIVLNLRIPPPQG